MKKIVRIGLLLVLVAFLHNLINVFVRAEYWEEPGAAQNTVELYTTFGDWEFFYHEDFETTTVREQGQTFTRSNGVNFLIEGEVIDENNPNSIEGKGVLLKPGDGYGSTRRLIIEFPRGLGGFSFNYKNIKAQDNSAITTIKVYDDNLEKEPAHTKNLTSDDEVDFIRYDFNVRPTGESEIVTVIIETISGSQVVIDNIRWSDYDIKVDFKDGYNENTLFTTKYVRYGRKVDTYITEVEGSIYLEGYENFKWYTNPELTTLFDDTTPIREDLTLYLDRDLIIYEIEYELNGGFFEPFANRDEMIVAFLTDLYNYLDDNDKLISNEFHQVLIDQDLANPNAITLDDFIYGTGYNKENTYNGTYGGIYNGLFAKGFVVSTFEGEDEYPINFDLNGGIFANIGGTPYTNRVTMRNDFLNDFHTYLTKEWNYKFLNTLNTDR